MLSGIFKCTSGGGGGGSLVGDDDDFVVCESCEDGAHMCGELRDDTVTERELCPLFSCVLKLSKDDLAREHKLLSTLG